MGEMTYARLDWPAALSLWHTRQEIACFSTFVTHATVPAGTSLLI